MSDSSPPQEVTLAITGASGFPYAWRLIGCLVDAGAQVHLMVSRAARVVAATESGIKLKAQPRTLSEQIGEHFSAAPGQIQAYGEEDWFSPVASGSGAPTTMVICPCSTGTLSAVAQGASNNLIERAADVVLKERKQLILVPRETPFSTLHLENMLRLSRMGVTILPAAPGFYHQPRSIEDMVDFIVARILTHMGFSQELIPRWGRDA